MASSTARFVTRDVCIQCGGSRLTEVCSGGFESGPVHDFIASDPWGENPLPFLVGCTWSYVRCEECHQAFHRRILSPEWNERRFSKWMSQEAIAEFESRVNTPARRFNKGVTYVAHAIRLEALTRRLRGSERLRVLDFGCGYGDFLATCAGFGFDATGIDRSTARRENARVPILPEISDAQHMRVHALTLFEVLEHLDDPMAIMKALVPLLVPGGILVLETPNCEGVTRIQTRTEYLKIAPMEHINGFTPRTMQAFAERLGFVRIKPSPPIIAAEAPRMLRGVARAALAPWRKDTTQQYFRKT